MELKKPIEETSSVDGGGCRSKRSFVNGDSHKSTEPIDHWDFLEEIDAPMWADLALESISTEQDINASWFEVAHPFHQLSTHHLLGEGKVISDGELLVPSSPGLPSSVSKSRGKHYKSRKWRGDNHTVSVGKKHPIESFHAKSSLVNLSSYQELQPKGKISSRNPKGTLKLKGKLLSEGRASCTARSNSLQRKPGLQNPNIKPNLKASFVGVSTSNVTRKSEIAGAKPCFGNSQNAVCTTSYSGCGNTSTSGPEPDKHKVSFINSCHSNVTTSGDGSYPIKPKVSYVDSCSSNTATSDNGPSSARHKVSFVVDSGTSHSITPNDPQSNSSVGDAESASNMAAGFVRNNNSASVNMSDSPKSKRSFGGPKSSLTSQGSSTGESIPQDVHTGSDLSHQIFGQTGGLLLAVRASLRRSYVTRQPARVEVKDKTQLNGRKSSLSKSSVGSSTNSGCNVKDKIHTYTVNKNRTREDRQATEVHHATNDNKAEVKHATKITSGKLQVRMLNSKTNRKTTSGRSVSQETSKPKISYQSQHRKPLRNVQNSCTDPLKAKDFVSSSNKGSLIGHSVPSQKIADKENNVKSMLLTQKALKHGAVGKEKEILDCKGKAAARNSVKNPKNVVQRVHFR